MARTVELQQTTESPRTGRVAWEKDAWGRVVQPHQTVVAGVGTQTLWGTFRKAVGLERQSAGKNMKVHLDRECLGVG